MTEPNSTQQPPRPCADVPPPAPNAKARTVAVNQARFLGVQLTQLREKIEALNITALDSTLDKIDGVSERLDDINSELRQLLGDH